MADTVILEWVESSGPVSPRYQYALHVRVEAGPDTADVTGERRDATGTRALAGILNRMTFDALLDRIRVHLPAGGLDLAAPLRDRKGISFNHVRLVTGNREARLDYVLTQAEEDPRVQGILGAIKAVVFPTLGLPA